ncbi:hypothetical protein H2198_010786 [Neophaeococcomyces mojaviensis]|uniref:Uncharacterized protein n=1 Tax=Neophaeococcomyces mojaviensis TaxID=3383035 RepID=A0ACC2ZQQ7_9EURO|nr:hypothetical protein H2198_010786 [Knufia sp. JES_112]
MTEPLQGLLQSVPGLLSAVGCFDRIGQFLAAEEQEDFRDFKSCHSSSTSSLTTAQTPIDGSETIELTSRSPRNVSMLPTTWQPIIRITNGCFGWSKDKDILKDVNVSIPGGRLTCIVGPIAGGKSTFCQTLLGETYASKGRVQFSVPSKEIAFCHQTAHLVNGSIRENNVGFSELDEKWYETILRACSLWEDVGLMPRQHETIVGSGGMNLSGGQRQKVAVARAIYARKSIVVLDDVFSGFDAGSEQHVFRQLFGPDGLARRQGMTIIFATHAVKFLPYADHIIALVDGVVEQEGTYEELRSQAGYVQGLVIAVSSKHQSATAKEPVTQAEKTQDAADAAKDDLSRQLGDFAAYRYYFSAAGLSSTLLMLAFGTATSTFFNLPTFWLKQWTDASSTSGQHDDYKYLGIYALFQCLALIFAMLLAYQTIIVLVTKTGLDLHLRLLQTVALSFTQSTWALRSNFCDQMSYGFV